MKTFLDIVRAGEANASDADAWVAAWHDRESESALDAPLHETMGLTFEEYGRWVKNPDFIKEKLKGEKPGRNDDNLTFEFGIDGDRQESSFMNATLREQGETVESIAIWAPEEYADLADVDYESALRRDLAPLITKGWKFHIQRGLVEEAAESRHDAMVEKFSKEMEA